MRAEICQCAAADIYSKELLTCAPEPAPTSQVTPSGTLKDGCSFFESGIWAGLWLLWPRIAVPVLGLVFKTISHFCLRLLEPWAAIRNPTTLLESLHEEALRTQRWWGVQVSPAFQSFYQGPRNVTEVVLDPQIRLDTRCRWLRSPSVYYRERKNCLAKAFPRSWPTKPWAIRWLLL